MGIHEAALNGFGRGAPAYERGRPSYPAEAVGWMTERLGIGAMSTVVDLGAGTGKFTRALVASGARVYGVEPSPEMREQLRGAVPAATVLNATAEAIPLPDGSVDAVTAAQAFHWFATERVLGELQRLLRDGGGLGLIWNRRDMSDPIQQALESIVAQHRAGAFGHESDRWMDTMKATRRFSPIGERQFSYEQSLDRAGLRDRVLSISFIAMLDDAGRRAVAEEVDAVVAGETAFRLPYRTEVYLFRRT
ncbi:MAG: class I SAM-dependent methyltransferase [Candidatus Dormibacter sp.]